VYGTVCGRQIFWCTIPSGAGDNVELQCHVPPQPGWYGHQGKTEQMPSIQGNRIYMCTHSSSSNTPEHQTSAYGAPDIPASYTRHHCIIHQTSWIPLCNNVRLNIAIVVFTSPHESAATFQTLQHWCDLRNGIAGCTVHCCIIHCSIGAYCSMVLVYDTL